MRDRVLITGATGKTGRRLLALLDELNISARAASRKPPAGGSTSTGQIARPGNAALVDVSSVYRSRRWEPTMRCPHDRVHRNGHQPCAAG